MAPRQGFGRVVSVLKCKEDGSLKLDLEPLKRLLLAEAVRDRPVAVISVAGAFRRGDRILDGFPFRGGSERETEGILLWSEIFLVTTSGGDEVAVVLMDTQGTFDGKSTLKGASTILALSMMLSSVQIYNILNNVGEDDLQHLQLFGEYGQLAETDCSSLPFQKLVFLVRDWSCPYEFSYGEEGGRAFIGKRLQIIDEQPAELRNLRRDIKSYFEEITCFLMPHPGSKVATDPEFKGSIADIEILFKNHVHKLLVAVLHPKNLRPKKINNSVVTCGNLLVYFEAYANCLSNGGIPDPMSFREATGRANNSSAMTKALQYYMNEMKMACESMTLFCEDALVKTHEEKRAVALQNFNAALKLGGKEMEKKYREDLMQVIDATFNDFIKRMNKKNKEKESMAEVFKTSFQTVGFVLLGLTFPPASAVTAIVLAGAKIAGAALTVAADFLGDKCGNLLAKTRGIDDSKNLPKKYRYSGFDIPCT